VTFGYRRTALWTSVAVLAAASTFVGLHRYLGWLRSQIPEGGLVPVVVAARDIEAGETVEADMLRTARVPPAAAPAGALRSPRSAAGSTAAVFVEEGQIVTARILGREGPSALLPRGMRAYDLPADAASGSLAPRQGDRVDVIVAFPGDGAVEPTARTVLSRATVAGVGQGDGTSTGAAAELGERPSARITLLVTPEEAERLATAEAYGRIRVVLASAQP
jgi:pilus assembly protein CpaB